MSVYRISYRYANSLFLLAEEKKSLMKLSEDAELIFNTLQGSKELRTILKNPVIKQKEKKNILTALFDTRVSKEIIDFLFFIVDKNREDLLYEIMAEFLNLRDQKEGIIRTEITSAVEFNDDIKKNMIKNLERQTSKTIQSKYKLNPELIGGFVVRIKDTVIDASVKHQLENLRKKFSEEISIKNN